MLDFLPHLKISVRKYNVLPATRRNPPNPIFHQINLICSLDQIYLIFSLFVALYILEEENIVTTL